MISNDFNEWVRNMLADATTKMITDPLSSIIQHKDKYDLALVEGHVVLARTLLKECKSGGFRLCVYFVARDDMKHEFIELQAKDVGSVVWITQKRVGD